MAKPNKADALSHLQAASVEVKIARECWPDDTLSGLSGSLLQSAIDEIEILLDHLRARQTEEERAGA